MSSLDALNEKLQSVKHVAFFLGHLVDVDLNLDHNSCAKGRVKFPKTKTPKSRSPDVALQISLHKIAMFTVVSECKSDKAHHWDVPKSLYESVPQMVEESCFILASQPVVFCFAFAARQIDLCVFYRDDKDDHKIYYTELDSC